MCARPPAVVVASGLSGGARPEAARPERRGDHALSLAARVSGSCSLLVARGRSRGEMGVLGLERRRSVGVAWPASRLGVVGSVVGSLGEGARMGESCCDAMCEDAETTDGVRMDGVRPRGEGSAHVGGSEETEEDMAGEEVTEERPEPA